MKRVVVLAIAACSRRAPIASCDDDLRGVYVAGGERWMVLDHGDTLEAYPLFPDGAAPEPSGTAVAGSPAPGPVAGPASWSGPAAVVVAPRVIDFKRPVAAVATAPGRAGTTPLAGTLRRRYMRRAERCEAHLPVHVTHCAGDTLELVLADPSPPIEFSPCTWSLPDPSRVERWRRE